MVGQILDYAPRTSDIIITVGKRIQAEVDGELKDVPLDPDPGELNPWHTESIVESLLNRNMKLYEDLIRTGSCDLSYELRGRTRFRVNIFHQKGSLAIVMR